MKRFLAALVFLAALTAPAHAQFIGYTSPQTVTSQPFGATATNCTGGLQRAIVPNLGQAVHFVTIVSSISPISLSVRMYGSFDGTNFSIFSDTATFGSVANISGQLQANGYYPVMAVGVTCGSASGNFIVNYAGTDVTPNPPAGINQASQIIKVLIAGASDATTQSFPIQPQTPFGSSGGMLVFFQNGAAPPAGSSLSINCDSFSAANLGNFTFPLSSTSAAASQAFIVPGVPCVNPSVAYTSGGASANTYTLYYLFSQPGSQAGFPAALDPCQTPGTAKSSAVVTAPAAATTQIIAGVAGQVISVCGYNLGNAAAAAGTMQWTTGTGGACGANTVTKTGAIPFGVAVPPFSYGPGSTLFTAAAGSAVCLTTTGAGDNAAGIITFVQQ